MSYDIYNEIKNSIEVKQLILNDNILLEKIIEISNICTKTFKSGKKILICGNGGSACDAQHMVAELVGRFKLERKGLPAIALNSNIAIITAISNDYSYDNIFSRQVEALGIEGDILLGISTSGNSNNILDAIKSANFKGLISIGLIASKGGNMQKFCNYSVVVPSNDTPRIQESHIMIIHILCDLIERNLFGEKNE